MTHKPFKTVLKEFRTSAGLTQQQVADATNLGRVYIAQLESGKRFNPALDVIKRLSGVLGNEFADAVSLYCLRSYSGRKKSVKKSM